MCAHACVRACVFNARACVFIVPRSASTPRHLQPARVAEPRSHSTPPSRNTFDAPFPVSSVLVPRFGAHSGTRRPVPGASRSISRGARSCDCAPGKAGRLRSLPRPTFALRELSAACAAPPPAQGLFRRLGRTAESGPPPTKRLPGPSKSSLAAPRRAAPGRAWLWRARSPYACRFLLPACRPGRQAVQAWARICRQPGRAGSRWGRQRRRHCASQSKCNVLLQTPALRGSGQAVEV